MLAHCGNRTVVNEYDAISQRNGARSMSNNNRCATLHHCLHGIANFVLFARVDCTCGVVQHEYPWVGDDGASNGHTLTLTTTQRKAALANRCVVSVRQLQDELVGASQSCCALDSCLIGIWFGKSDVVAHRVVEQKCVFKHDSHIAP